MGEYHLTWRRQEKPVNDFFFKECEEISKKTKKIILENGAVCVI